VPHDQSSGGWIQELALSPLHDQEPPTPTVFDQRGVDWGAIQQRHVSKGANYSLARETLP
jgi:hypothetical protein